MKHLASFCLLLLASLAGFAQDKRSVTLEDLMGLSTIIDVKISPDGSQAAYVVSTPSLQKNQHEPVLFVISTSPGSHQPLRLADGTRIMNTGLPAPRLRWHPDGKRISFMGLKEDKPQVFIVNALGGDASLFTDAPEGIVNYEWSPDGGKIVCAGSLAVPSTASCCTRTSGSATT